MDKALVDTDILSEILKGYDQTVIQNVANYQRHFPQLTLSTASITEITKGLWKKRKTAKLASFLSLLKTQEIVPFDTACAELAGKLFADLERKGLPIGWGDVIIGATAITHDLVLVTGNMKHFGRLNQVGYAIQLMNWREAV